MKKSTGKMALMLGVAAAMGMDTNIPMYSNSEREKVRRHKSFLTPKQTKKRKKNNLGKKARKQHRK